MILPCIMGKKNNISETAIKRQKLDSKRLYKSLVNVSFCLGSL